MFRAIDSGDAGEVMRLLDVDPKLLEETDMIHDPMDDRLTPLMYAARFGQLGMVKLFIGRGANIHATMEYGMTALHFAAEQGHEEVVAYLLHKGAQPGEQDTTNGTPLTDASMSGHTRVVLLLLEHMGGQGLEARTDDGYTALHLAADGGHEEVVAHLLRHGARADTTDGTSALRNAVRRGHVGVVKLLLDHLEPEALQEKDDEGWSLLHFAIDGRHDDMVVFLLGKGLRPDTADNQGLTALMYGVGIPSICGTGSSSIEVLQRLLEHMAGQGLDERDDDGWTALHYAAGWNRPENVRALLLAGADPTILDNEGSTPRLTAETDRCYASVATFDWWDAELERGALLYRARALHDAYTMHRQASTCPVPGYVAARVRAGLVLPRVEVVAGQQEVRGGAGEGEAEVQQKRHGMLGYVVGELNGELFAELMQGFHAPRN